jgi:hypothetical protein
MEGLGMRIVFCALECRDPTPSGAVCDNALGNEGHIRHHEVEESVGTQDPQTFSEEAFSRDGAEMIQEMEHSDVLGMIVMKRQRL